MARGYICEFFDTVYHLFCAGINSKMLDSSPFYQDKLNLWLAAEGFGDKYWIPCFRGIEDGWNASVFDSLCAKKEATVTIIRKGDCLFGGFADKPWSKLSRKYHGNNGCMHRVTHFYFLSRSRSRVKKN